MASMRFSASLALVASIGFAAAKPTIPSGNVDAVLHPDSGCGSYGPLGDDFRIWYIVRNCTAGARMTCQATDRLGCVPGATAYIQSMEVDDPYDTFNVARGSHVNTVPFICPQGGSVRCQINLDNKNSAGNFSLRVFQDA